MIFWSLVVVAVLTGLCSAWVFRSTTNAAALRATRKRIYAYLLEFRLDSGEPRIIWQAQKALIRENARLLRLMLPPLLILTLPMAWLLLQLDSVFGVMPLPLDRPALVTAQLNRPLQPSDALATLDLPSGIALETMPVRIVADRQIVWRIRPINAVSGSMRLSLGSNAAQRSIAAGRRGIYLPRRTAASGDVAWLEVDYPRRGWLAWFLVISTAATFGFSSWLKR